MAFQDHFSTQAADYALYRPTCPPEVFAFIADACRARSLAVDVGAGNGQASVELARHFERVVAVEPSAEQLESAIPNARVSYQEAPAEALPVADGTANLVVACQAAHWFALDAFYAEARRISAPGGILAIVGYGKTVIAPELDPLVEDFYTGVVGPYWPAGRALVENGYRDLAFPFKQLEVPRFEIVRSWTIADFMGYVGTWSAVARLRKQTGQDPLPSFEATLGPVWAGVRTVRWPIALLMASLP